MLHKKYGPRTNHPPPRRIHSLNPTIKMQFKNVLLFGLLGGAMAQSSATLATINSAFGTIGTALDALDGAVKTLAAGNAATQAKALISKSEAVAKAIKDATAKISASKDSLALTDALGVSSSANSLLAKTESTIGSLTAKKDLIAKAGELATTKAQLVAQKSAADGLATAITDKMPSAAKSIAKTQAGKIGSAIDKGIAAFS
jgi:hypothetical protein